MHPYLRFVFASNEQEKRDAEQLLDPQLVWTTKFMGYGFLAGFFSGGYLGASQRSKQFLAENAHRLPKLVSGWYYYHKYKNYEMIIAGLQSGLKYSTRFSLMIATFCGIESVCERLTDTEGIINSTAAGLGSAATFGTITRLGRQYSRQYLVHALRFGLYGGLAIGLTQEFYSFIYGESAKYPGKKLKMWSDYEFGRSIKEKWEITWEIIEKN